jgi:phosphatidylserine/phosphatidylglycerophosphate/cardiolipin synthase-like enzyme
MSALRFATYAIVLALSAFPAAARDIAPASVQTEVGFSPSRSAHELVLRAIQGAHQSILAAYSFTSKDIAKALVEAHRNGVDVRVVLDDARSPSATPARPFWRTPRSRREPAHATPSCITSFW